MKYANISSLKITNYFLDSSRLYSFIQLVEVAVVVVVVVENCYPLHNKPALFVHPHLLLEGYMRIRLN
jgi:hypothetical protein